MTTITNYKQYAQARFENSNDQELNQILELGLDHKLQDIAQVAAFHAVAIEFMPYGERFGDAFRV